MLIFCIFVICNPQSENCCDIAFISVKLPKLRYSQCIATRVIFGFCHMISPTARTFDNDWLNPTDLFINVVTQSLKHLFHRSCCCFLIAESKPTAHRILHFHLWSTYWRIDPDFSIEYFAKTSPIKDPADRKRLISALRKAGLMWFENILTHLNA